MKRPPRPFPGLSSLVTCLTAVSLGVACSLGSARADASPRDPAAGSVQAGSVPAGSPPRPPGSPPGQAVPDAKAPPPNARSLELNEQAVKLVRSKKFVEAEGLFRSALAADPKNVTAAFNLAGMYLQNKRESLAVDLLEKYARESPGDVGILARLGDAYFASKQVDKAVPVYEAAYAKDPKYPSVAVRLSTLYALKRRLPDAERLLVEAAKIEPKNARILGNLAGLELGLGKAEQAVKTAKKSLQLAPDAETYVTLGSAYLATGDPRNALIAFERARDLGDKRPELLRQIEALREAPRTT